MVSSSSNRHMPASHVVAQYHPIDKSKSGEISRDNTNLSDTGQYKDLQSLDSYVSKLGATVQATATAAGTTTTIVVSNADGGNVDVGDLLNLYDSAGTLLEEDRKITAKDVDVPSAGSTTLTFEPAADAATAIGDTVQTVLYNRYKLNKMTLNDKIHAVALDADSEMVNP